MKPNKPQAFDLTLNIVRLCNVEASHFHVVENARVMPRDNCILAIHFLIHFLAFETDSLITSRHDPDTRKVRNNALRTKHKCAAGRMDSGLDEYEHGLILFIGTVTDSVTDCPSHSVLFTGKVTDSFTDCPTDSVLFTGTQ